MGLYKSNVHCYKTYAGFRHPDRMAPDQTVRGGENECPILSGNLLPKLLTECRIVEKEQKKIKKE